MGGRPFARWHVWALDGRKERLVEVDVLGRKEAERVRDSWKLRTGNGTRYAIAKDGDAPDWTTEEST